MNSRILRATLVLISVPLVISAGDSVTLSNGKKVTCQILTYEAGIFTIKKPDGATKRIARTKIRKIEFDIPETGEDSPASQDVKMPELVGTYTVSEVERQMFDLQDNIIQLKFNYRSGIIQIDKGYYSVNLWDDDKNIVLQFPREAYDWFENLPEYSQHFKKKWKRGKGSWRYLYALVTVTDIRVMQTGATSKGALLIAVGRRKSTRMGGMNQYSW